MSDGPIFQQAMRRIDEENSRDPNSIEGTGRPHELVYSEWVTAWILKLAPEASEALRLAARSQHICRWMIPRKSYPMTRAGYLKWRADLKQFHAEKSAEILREAGYDEDIIQRVQELNLKKNLAPDSECQTLEDALCLVTLEHQLGALIEKTEHEKMVGIIKKTWKKMSPQARDRALTVKFTETEKMLIQEALG